MEPSPRAETSNLHFFFLRFCLAPHSIHGVMRAMICGGGLVMLPSNSPVLIRVRRLHDKLFAGECEYARQLFAWQRPHQCALNVEGESVSVCINLIGAIGGLVTALRIRSEERRVGKECRSEWSADR